MSKTKHKIYANPLCNINLLLFCVINIIYYGNADSYNILFDVGILMPKNNFYKYNKYTTLFSIPMALSYFNQQLHCEGIQFSGSPIQTLWSSLIETTSQVYMMYKTCTKESKFYVFSSCLFCIWVVAMTRYFSYASQSDSFYFMITYIITLFCLYLCIHFAI